MRILKAGTGEERCRQKKADKWEERNLIPVLPKEKFYKLGDVHGKNCALGAGV